MEFLRMCPKVHSNGLGEPVKLATHFMDQVQRGCRISNVFARRQPHLLLHL